MSFPYQLAFGWNTGNAEERSDQEMRDQGWTRYRNPSELPSGATTHRVTRKQDITYVAGDNENFGQVDLDFDYYKAPETQQAAAPAPTAAAPAAPAPEQRVDTIGSNAPSPNKPETDFGASGSGAVGDKPRDDDEGYLDKYLSRGKSDYGDWNASRVERNAENRASSSSWDRYFRDEFKESGPSPTYAKDHEAKGKRWRMAGGGDFLNGINGFLGNYSKADSA